MVRERRNSKSGTANSLSKRKSIGRSSARLSSSTRNKNLQPAKQSSRTSQRLQRGERVFADMLGDPSLSFAATTRKHKVDRRWVLKHLGWKFGKDSSGRIRAKVRNKRHKTLYKPTDTPGVHRPVDTKSKGERQLLGQWMAALNAAGRGDWSKMKKFPKRQHIGGVLLETDPKEVQAILDALAEEESPFEGLYRTTVRRS